MNPLRRPGCRALLGSVLALGLCVAGGCGKSAPSEVTIRGKVKWNGEPVSKGRIDFFPVEGKTRTAGALITDGAYEVTVPVGKHRVEIYWPKEVGQKPMY